MPTTRCGPPLKVRPRLRNWLDRNRTGRSMWGIGIGLVAFLVQVGGWPRPQRNQPEVRHYTAQDTFQLVEDDQPNPQRVIEAIV